VPQSVAQPKQVDELLLHSLTTQFNLNPTLPVFPTHPIDPDFVILETSIHPTFEDLDNMSPALLNLLTDLNIPTKSISRFDFAPKGIQIIFTDPTPIDKFVNPAYQVEGLGLLLVHKPFDPTWVFSGLSNFPDNQIDECLKAFRSVKECNWLNTCSNIKSPFLKVMFMSITPALAVQHYLDPKTIVHTICVCPYPTQQAPSCR
jgi:hypothetical protein